MQRRFILRKCDPPIKTGDKFNQWTVLVPPEENLYWNKMTVVCICGNVRTLLPHRAIIGLSKGCGHKTTLRETGCRVRQQINLDFLWLRHWTDAGETGDLLSEWKGKEIPISFACKLAGINPGSVRNRVTDKNYTYNEAFEHFFNRLSPSDRKKAYERLRQCYERRYPFQYPFSSLTGSQRSDSSSISDSDSNISTDNADTAESGFVRAVDGHGSGDVHSSPR